MLKKFAFAIIILVVGSMTFQGCYKLKADVVYPGGCDTTIVRYSVEIRKILDENCASCHPSTNGIDLYDYATISALALDGQHTYGTLLSAVKHEGGASPMPQGAQKLGDCDINTIAAWVNRGAPDN